MPATGGIIFAQHQASLRAGKNSPQQENLLTMGKVKIKKYHATNGIFGSK
jgi:hypothetical protein